VRHLKVFVVTGKFCIDDELLAGHGINNLEESSLKPGTQCCILDLFVD
jgi:hypothetical protein